MIKNELERGWLAGILEGEGAFCINRRLSGKQAGSSYITVGITSTDKDVINRVAELVGWSNVNGPYLRKNYAKAKPVYNWSVFGNKAIEVMLTVRDLMGERRRARIDECLAHDTGRY